MSQVLILEPRDEPRAQLTQAFNESASSVIALDNPLEAVMQLGKKQYSIIIIGMKSAELEALKLIPMLKKHAADAQIILYNDCSPMSVDGVSCYSSTQNTPEQLAAEVMADVHLEPTEAPAKTMGSDRRILIVEDDRDLNMMYQLAFTKRGFKVKTALNGIDGVTEAVVFKPDLILLDIMMPQMDGYEVIQAMRKNTSMQTVIVVNSNIEQENDLEKAITMGADYYLRKAQHTAFEVVDMVAENKFPGR